MTTNARIPTIEEIRQFNEIRYIVFNKPNSSEKENQEWDRLRKVIEGYDLLGITLDKIEQLELELELKTIDANTMMQKISRLEAVIKKIDLTLRVPAAEYVPAIQDVFQIIDDAILKQEKGRV